MVEGLSDCGLTEVKKYYCFRSSILGIGTLEVGHYETVPVGVAK